MNDFAQVSWTEDDMRNILDYYSEAKPTDKNLQTLYDAIDETALIERMVEAGYAYIESIVDELLERKELETYEED